MNTGRNDAPREDNGTFASTTLLDGKELDIIHGSFRGGIRPVCSHFGCPVCLSLIEQLAGSKCTEHMNTKPILVTSIIKYK